MHPLTISGKRSVYSLYTVYTPLYTLLYTLTLLLSQGIRPIFAHFVHGTFLNPLYTTQSIYNYYFLKYSVYSVYTVSITLTPPKG